MIVNNGCYGYKVIQSSNNNKTTTYIFCKNYGGRGSEIILSKICQGDEIKKLAKIVWKKAGKSVAKMLIDDFVIKKHLPGCMDGCESHFKDCLQL